MPPWAHKESLPDEKSGRLSYFAAFGLTILRSSQTRLNRILLNIIHLELPKIHFITNINFEIILFYKFVF